MQKKNTGVYIYICVHENEMNQRIMLPQRNSSLAFIIERNGHLVKIEQNVTYYIQCVSFRCVMR